MLLFAITIFLSAFLLFQVQPMIAKMILPWFGGTAAVWATCLLFFQTVLLAGYTYSHGIINRLKPRTQWIVHSTLAGLCLLALPILPNPAWKPATPDAPVLHILGLLAVTIGLPYFLLSTTGPLLQAWYVQSHPGRIPYRLFALSNLGSMLALLSYPPLIEPLLTLRQQAWSWSAAFALFVAVCVYTGWRSYRTAVVVQPAEGEEEAAPERPGSGRRGLWIVLATAPSMLLLALTGHLSMDLAPIPFLWVLPLALYLLSFILCFDAEGWYRRIWFLAALPLALGVIIYLAHLGPADRPNTKLSVFAYALSFFIVCMVCHGELARLKPHPRLLTGYFLMISIGGALGGVFVAMLAPVVFNAFYELPVAMGVSVVAVAAALLYDKEWPFRGDWLGWPSIALYTVAAVILGFCGREINELAEGSMFVGRNFYGELRVRQYGSTYELDSYRSLVHGTINHGEQYSHPARRSEIATYYCENSGLGLVMQTRVLGTFQRVGVIGLGTGTIAAYSRIGDVYRFYDINPLVEQIANNHFWYLKNAEGYLEVVLGDARLSLEREAPQNYDILAVDAFSSDSIPVHLLTREAIALYFHHLKPGGVLAVHVSNRFIDLVPVLERAAAALGKPIRVVETEDDTSAKCYGTTWVLLGGPEHYFERPEFKPATVPTPAPWLKVWSDDFSNLYSVLR